MKKTLVISCFMLTGIFILAGCGGEDQVDKIGSGQGNLIGGNSNKVSESDSCYGQCEAFGGGAENVKMCKANCNASADGDSVWNQSDEEIADENDATFSSWSEMPTEVPEFGYGSFVAGEEGLGSWIVDYENVTEDALGGYTQDLKDAGWSASKVDVSGLITGSYEGAKGYSISVNIDKDMKQSQIIVRKKN